MSKPEQKLWSELREWKNQYGVRVRRQVPIGSYFADFAILSERLIIEVDGFQHQYRDQIMHDQKRDAWMKERGYRVVRLSTGELDENFDGCVEHIMLAAGLMDN